MTPEKHLLLICDWFGIEICIRLNRTDADAEKSLLGDGIPAGNWCSVC
jgi:hypothetical protein